MKKRLAALVLTISCGAFPACGYAVDLLGVYNQALSSDPTFQSARSSWLATREQIGISRAGLLPSFSINAGYNRNWVDSSGVTDNTYRYNSFSYTLEAQQPIFNYQAWSSLKNARATAKSAAATYSASAQDLIYRTAAAYFNVLKSQDLLRYNLAEQRSIKRQLQQAKQQFNVGLIAITAVYQAQATYDAQDAAVIQARNDLDNKKELLREITGQYYGYFSPLISRIPLLTPNPKQVSQWLATAKRQNYQLLAALYTMIAARDNISIQGANRLPTLDADGTYTYTDNNNSVSGVPTKNKSATLGLSMNFPVLQGGSIGAKTQQAEYQYQKTISDLEITQRSTVSSTRQAYLAVMSLISKIKADRQAVKSNQSALRSTEAAYIVGTSTMLDVLQSQASLYNAQKLLASDQYDYLLQTLALKQAAGSLSVDDLQKINSWLQKNNAGTYPQKTSISKPSYTGKKTSNPIIISRKKPTNIKQQILSMNPRHYTIQIIASPSASAIIAFTNKFAFAKPVLSYRTIIKGKNWYKLFSGDYSTRIQAENAVQKLPKQAKIETPWIRTFASIQKNIADR